MHNKFDLAVNTISQNDINSLIRWLQNNPRLTMDAETKKFEDEWCDWLGVKYSVMCNSGSSANLLMYAALEYSNKTNGMAIVPATGWCTSIAPAIQMKWVTEMCGNDKNTLALDATQLEELLKKHTKIKTKEDYKPITVLLVHVLGVPANMTKIMELQKEYGFNLLEDCCAAHGARHQDKKVGTFGLMSSFSFYYGHHMSTIEGGMVCTNDTNVYHTLLMLRSHGWLKDLPEYARNSKMAKNNMDSFHNPFLFDIPGFNLRSTDLNAYIGQLQLKRLDKVVETRHDNHLEYHKQLKNDFMVQHWMEGDYPSSISFLVVAKSPEERKKIVLELDKHNIETRIFTAGNLGNHPFWKSCNYPFDGEIANKLNAGGFFLPNNQTMTTEDVRHVASIVTKAI